MAQKTKTPKAVPATLQPTKQKYFKLFDLPNGEQILFEKNSNNEEESEEIQQTIHLEGAKIVLSMGYGDDEDKRDAFFEEIDLPMAEKLYNNIIKMLSGE